MLPEIGFGSDGALITLGLGSDGADVSGAGFGREERVPLEVVTEYLTAITSACACWVFSSRVTAQRQVNQLARVRRLWGVADVAFEVVLRMGRIRVYSEAERSFLRCGVTSIFARTMSGQGCQPGGCQPALVPPPCSFTEITMIPATLRYKESVLDLRIAPGEASKLS